MNGRLLVCRVLNFFPLFFLQTMFEANNHNDRKTVFTAFKDLETVYVDVSYRFLFPVF